MNSRYCVVYQLIFLQKNKKKLIEVDVCFEGDRKASLFIKKKKKKKKEKKREAELHLKVSQFCIYIVTLFYCIYSTTNCSSEQIIMIQCFLCSKYQQSCFLRFSYFSLCHILIIMLSLPKFSISYIILLQFCHKQLTLQLIALGSSYS